jgi:hypothetical protein
LPARLALKRRFEWRGSVVSVFSGAPSPEQYAGFPTPAWVVSAQWSYRGHDYAVSVAGVPAGGSINGLSDGTRTLGQLFAIAEYA